MKKSIFKLLLLVSAVSSATTQAATQKIDNLTIKMIRAVGDYHAGTTFDDTIELWFTSPLEWNSEMNCSITYRVYVDASKTHIVSAAYMAFASGKKVSINADDALPRRSGSCEISYFDVLL